MEDQRCRYSCISEEVIPFLCDLMESLNSRFRGEIVSVILFGSAARGEFIKGKSDVDIIVICSTRDSNMKNKIKKFVGREILRLSKIYDMNFENTFHFHKVFPIGFISRFVLCQPCIVLGKQELDKDFRVRILSKTVAREGIVISGENIIPEFEKIELRYYDRVLKLIASIFVPLVKKFNTLGIFIRKTEAE